MSAAVCQDEVIKCRRGFLVGERFVNLLGWLDLGEKVPAVSAFAQMQFCLLWQHGGGLSTLEISRI